MSLTPTSTLFPPLASAAAIFLVSYTNEHLHGATQLPLNLFVKGQQQIQAFSAAQSYEKSFSKLSFQIFSLETYIGIPISLSTM